MSDRPKRAFAVAAHPDDIEFLMAGTLMLLGEAGYEIHYMNIANGSCGTATYDYDEIVAMRDEEARAAAGLIGAVFHPPLVDDLDIYYDKNTLAGLTAVVREIEPEIMLVQSPQDYMEDHMNACRLAVTAAFCRGMRNFATRPPVKPVAGDVTLYHSLPHGLRDPLRRRVFPGLYVDVSSTIERKRDMLACHTSQKEWLDVSQGMDAYLNTMTDQDAEVGRLSRRFQYAEGWRRHSHLGFCAADADPLPAALGSKAFVDEAYERDLERRPGE